jgi:D-alanine-D-alanine ligase
MENRSKRIRVAVLYGGRSGEHEVSLRSAASVIRHLDASRYDVIPIGIDKQGRWHVNDVSLLEKGGEKSSQALPAIHPDAPAVALPSHPTANGQGTGLVPAGPGAMGKAIGVDVIFPVMHGTYCEDGTMQGLLELADVPYVGCGVLASAVGMDKDVAKRLIQGAGLPIVPYIALKVDSWKKDRASVERQVRSELGYPCFVKPANAGSSVGVHKVKAEADLSAALTDSFRYDMKVLIEKAISAREIEVSVLENPDSSDTPLVSVAGEIAPTHEFYSYESKYLDDNGAVLTIPAKLSPEQAARAQEIGRRAFVALECEGMARVDMFVDRGTGEFYFNEINTLPGFTSISMYPKLWEASGLGYSELLAKLIELALTRHARRKHLVRDFHPVE